MKKKRVKKPVKRGCLISIICMITIIFVMYIYWFSPNKIRFHESPITKERYTKEIGLNSFNQLVLNQNHSNIIYQAFLRNESLFDKSTTYISVLAMNKDINLDNPLPLDSTQQQALNRKIAYTSIASGFSPKIKLPKSAKTSNGIHFDIYSNQNQIFMPLKSGSYSIYYRSIDGEGSLNEIIIYDSETKLLYYEITRYFAFV